MIPGAPPPTVQELSRIQERSTFLYLEHAVIHRDGNALTARDSRGTVHVPAASLAALMLGPGTSISHQAIVLMAECASTVVWVGEQGVRYYAHGRTLARGTRLLEAQARMVSSRSERIAVARSMYAMRFPGEDVSRMTMQQLRGREGARVRRSYREHSERTGVAWTRRDYRPDDFAASDPINQAMSAAHTALYGVVHAVVVASCTRGMIGRSCTTSLTCTRPTPRSPLPSMSQRTVRSTSARRPGGPCATSCSANASSSGALVTCAHSSGRWNLSLTTG
jgi:CRISPR-associated protein Cas1